MNNMYFALGNYQSSKPDQASPLTHTEWLSIEKNYRGSCVNADVTT
jgi:hypothetical protein